MTIERARVANALEDQGWQVPSPQGNFVWLTLGESSDEFAAACDEVGVSVRPFPPDGVRVTIGEKEANDLLLATTDEWLSDRG